MNGIDVYNDKINRKIEALIEKVPEYAWLKDFVSYLTSSLSENSVYAYARMVTTFVQWTERANVSDIRLTDYMSYMRKMKDMSSSYRIDIYTALKHFSTFLTYYEDEETRRPVADKDYMEAVKRPKFVESKETLEKRAVNYLSEDEIKEYISSVRNYDVSAMLKAGIPDWRSRDLLIILIFLTTGIRCSALYKLDVSSINIRERTLTTVDKGSKVHTFILPDQVIDTTLEWLDFRRSFLEKKERQSEVALFVNQYGDRLGQRGIANVTKKYGSLFIYDRDITPHKLRSTFGTELYRKTKDLYLTQKMMTHSDPKTTGLYIRGLEEEMRERTADVISGIIC